MSPLEYEATGIAEVGTATKTGARSIADAAAEPASAGQLNRPMRLITSQLGRDAIDDTGIGAEGNRAAGVGDDLSPSLADRLLDRV